MKAFFFLSVMLICQLVNCQQVKLSGEVSILNSKTWNKTRQYVSGAFVQDKYLQQQPTSTNGVGQFELVFVGMEASNTVHITIKATGLSVVNTDVLSAILGQKEMIKISMANPDSLADYQRRLFVTGKTQAEKKMDILLAQKTSELNILKKNTSQNVTKIVELEKDYAGLLEKSKSINELASSFAEDYYSVNLDDASPLFRTAFSLFEQGDIDSAMTILKEIDLHKKVGEALKASHNIDSLKRVNDSVIVALKEWLQLTGKLSQLTYEFDGTADCFQMLLQLDSTNVDYLVDYANFLDRLNRHDSSIAIYTKALEICKAKYTGDAYNYNNSVARVQSNLGILYLSKNEMDKAEAALQQALLIRKHNADTADSSPQLANTENNLGLLYRQKGDFAAAKQFFFEALIIRQQLVEINATANEPDLAASFNNIGTLYSSVGNAADSALYFLNTALNIYKRLAGGASRYDEPTARIYNNLGVLYFNRGQYEKADTALTFALAKRRQLALINPQAFEPDLAETQNNLGNLYTQKKDYSRADMAFHEALVIRRKFAASSPGVYNLALAQTLGNFAALYQTKNPAGAIDFFREALLLRRLMAEKNLSLNQPFVANILAGIGTAYYRTSLPDSGLAPLKEAVLIYKNLYSVNPALYRASLANTLYYLGAIYLLLHRKNEASDAYMQSLSLYQQLDDANPGQYSAVLESINTKIEDLNK